MLDVANRTDLLTRLRDEISACGRPGQTDRSIVPTGWPALDRLLPGGGVRRGSLVELLDERAGCGAETVAAVLTRTVCRTPGVVVIVDRDGQFYPPALAAWGVAFDRLIVVRATGDVDALWAADQALRSRAAVAVWLRPERLTAPDYRRLQLSAVEGGAVGVLFRPARARGQPTGADLQLAVEPRPSSRGRTLHIEVTRCRGGSPGSVAEICIHEDNHRETSPVSAVAALADPAIAG
jgi:protein ImuA